MDQAADDVTEEPSTARRSRAVGVIATARAFACALCAWLVCGGTLAASPTSVRSVTDDDAPGRARAILAREIDTHESAETDAPRASTYQRELPYSGRDWAATVDESDPNDHTDDRGGGSGSGLGAIAWLVLAPLAALALVKLVQQRRRARDVVAGDEQAAPAHPAPLDRAALDDAEALAREGRFGEAVHALLLRTLQSLARDLGRPLTPGTTSRSFAGRLRLAAPHREALDGLVHTVELSLFAGREADADAYRRCAEAWHVLADSFDGGAPS